MNIDITSWIKIVGGVIFGFAFSFFYHAWQMKTIKERMAGPTTYAPQRGMVQRLLVTTGVIFGALFFVPEPKLPFLLGMVLGMIGMTLWLLVRLVKQGLLFNTRRTEKK